MHLQLWSIMLLTVVQVAIPLSIPLNILQDPAKDSVQGSTQESPEQATPRQNFASHSPQNYLLNVYRSSLTRAAYAGTCASHCGPPPLQFEPGQLIQVELINLTSNLVQVQEAQGSDSIPLHPGRTIRLNRWGNTTLNSSIVFWDALGLALQTKIIKPQDNLLRIELHPGYHPPGDRSVYIRDDGQIEVF